ncbi:hypothetical protein BGZ95_003022 [Linnemannia exigua]|uniref:F-box domain-containing protein n=1 Tax=Linnemannia exigua TaxID=604196 RepID=A0AAD4D574_9FUNG|nr:hypothetical protein BGZ95_003022 [Linnemannia exigua]
MSAAVPATNPPQLETIKALGIPEITSLVGQYLAKTDLASCTLVAHAWFHVFMPILWKSIQAGHPNPSRHQDYLNLDHIRPDTTGTRSTLSKNGSFIRILTIIPEPDDTETSDLDLVSDCPVIDSLVHLDATLAGGQQAAVESIVKRNQDTLRLLKLIFHLKKHLRPSGWLGERMLEFPRMAPSLQSLFLEFWCMSKQELVLILKGCPTLKLLSLGNIHILDRADDCGVRLIEQGVDSDTEETFQHQSIESYRMCSRLCPILEHLPKIKLLEFYRFDRPIKDGELQKFCASIRTNCPNLQDVWSYGFECSMLPAVLDSLPRLVNYRGSSHLPTILSMLDHYETLEDANLSEYTERTFLPLRFLESCPRLRSFWTGHSLTTMDEVLHSIRRGWACQPSLKELRLNIVQLSPNLIEVIMRQLNAARAPDRRLQQRRSIIPTAQEDALLEAYKRQKEQELQDEIRALSPAQEDFRQQLVAFLATLDQLKRLNFGTGWYVLSRQTSAI